jgi:hypothetical protein
MSSVFASATATILLAMFAVAPATTPKAETPS